MLVIVNVTKYMPQKVSKIANLS